MKEVESNRMVHEKRWWKRCERSERSERGRWFRRKQGKKDGRSERGKMKPGLHRLSFCMGDVQQMFNRGGKVK
jgi:hypothetical protein